MVPNQEDVVSEEFQWGGGGSQSPRPVPFSCLLRHIGAILLLLPTTTVGYPPKLGETAKVYT